MDATSHTSQYFVLLTCIFTSISVNNCITYSSILKNFGSSTLGCSEYQGVQGLTNQILIYLSSTVLLLQKAVIFIYLIHFFWASKKIFYLPSRNFHLSQGRGTMDLSDPGVISLTLAHKGMKQLSNVNALMKLIKFWVRLFKALLA